MTTLTALIGTPESLRGVGADPSFVRLSQGFVLVPVGERAWDSIGAALTDEPDTGVGLPRFLEIILRAVGLRRDPPGPVAYLELDRFQQSGFVVVDGAVADSFVTQLDGSRSQTAEAELALNRVLRHLGVRVGDGADECAVLGLTRYLVDRAP